ncbi:hypothetical protein AALP_AA2G053900 [Arabis alpina]|uniref:ZCF37 n=1 Tax=Arabis alpina TaxID=50452 RepID=A0A087HFH5_ARAAL|nr:hypothetical protein AALP_AA2G053900 [Arabis alpina]
MVSPFKSPCSSPRKSRKERKNPYSNRGLDKFSELLSELDEKRQSIYSKKVDSGGGPPLVRFVFTSSGECVPVVIKSSYIHKKKKNKKKDVVAAAKVNTVVNESKTEEIKETEPEIEEKHNCVLNENLKKITRPNNFLPVTVILVLVFLSLFGRSVAIMCTCIAWYLVPMIKEQRGNRGSSLSYAMKKKDFARKLSIENRASFNPRTLRDHSPLN